MSRITVDIPDDMLGEIRALAVHDRRRISQQFCWLLGIGIAAETAPAPEPVLPANLLKFRQS